MFTVRNREGLQPEMIPYLNEFLYECETAKLDGLIHCTLRTYQEQSILYRQGRSFAKIKEKARKLEELYARPDLADILIGVGPQHGIKIRTNAGPGQSMHNYGLAWDGCPIWQGKLIYDDESDRVPDQIEVDLWGKYGECAMRAGLNWAGHWLTFREKPHCQIPDMNWRDLIAKGE